MPRAPGPPTATKVLVTNLGALRGKHGTDGVRRVRAAVHDLVVADAARGVRTRLVALDDGRAARPLGVPAVRDPADAAAAKTFIDALCTAEPPDYVVLLGAGDVVPQVPLRNPLWTGDPRRGDPDETVPSDLPYACDVPHSDDPGAFRGPTRVVGRLPDGLGVSDPTQLLRLLAVAARWRSRRRGDLVPPFALTAAEWRDSTTTTLQRLLGSPDSLADVPPHGPGWPASATRRRLHLVNLHGGVADPTYYGQKGSAYPPALSAADLAKSRVLVEGTVGAAESCYGGMLYDPADAGGVPGFADTYLAAGAYAYCAATTTAYGPAAGNDNADLICRFFLQSVLSGCSTGRALLQARQDYVFTKASLSPIDVKTLAQFVLYGDPSLHPVSRPATPAPGPVGTVTGAVPKGRRPAAPPSGLAARPRRLAANGSALQSTTTRAAAAPRRLAEPERRRLAAELIARGPVSAGEDPVVASFDVMDAPAAPAGPQERFHVLLARRPGGLHAVLAREEAGVFQQAGVLRER